MWLKRMPFPGQSGERVPSSRLNSPCALPVSVLHEAPVRKEPMSAPLTSFDALKLTRGQWRRTDDGRVRCPVQGCDVTTLLWDHARLVHLRWHLQRGWTPKRPQVEAVF